MLANADETYDHIPEGAGVPENRVNAAGAARRRPGRARYIIAEGPAGVYLIDQHNAHARGALRLSLSWRKEHPPRPRRFLEQRRSPQLRPNYLSRPFPSLQCSASNMSLFGSIRSELKAPDIIEVARRDTILRASIPENGGSRTRRRLF